MLAGAFVFSFAFCFVTARRCPSLTRPHRGTVSCSLANRTIPCTSAPPPHSLAEFTCLEHYRLTEGGRRVLECLKNGTWSSPAPKCVPDCGRRSVSVSLIVNGARGSRGAFPWHVGMYHQADGAYEYWCGGSLVSETAVVTAAHCVWHVPPESLVLAVGKFQREYHSDEGSVQRIRAKRVETLRSYQDVGGNYNGDIAVVFLERAVVLGEEAAPVCIDWGQRLVERQLAGGAAGVVVGWGLTENDTFSDWLRVVSLPVVPEEKCIAEQEQDFRKFVTYTSFCAGFRNGTGVCNGDSGGGMAFFDEGSARWYLQGVVSVSPRRRGTPYCDPHSYTVFTKVTLFSTWLQRLLKHTQHHSPPHTPPHNTRFPHTAGLLQLAGLLPPP